MMTMGIASTAYRVCEHTAPEVNERIQRSTEVNVAYYRQHPELIDQRLVELDREWDIERALEAHSATVGLIGTALAATVNRKWLIVPALITGFLFQHAIQGWCPQLPILRRLGFRTPDEIDIEAVIFPTLSAERRMRAGSLIVEAVEQIGVSTAM